MYLYIVSKAAKPTQVRKRISLYSFSYKSEAKKQKFSSWKLEPNIFDSFSAF